jgi:plasmid stabilization system protein ParE
VKRLQFHPDARAEFDDAAAYYEERRPGVGVRFRSAVEEAARQIQENPLFYPVSDMPPVRYSVIYRFPYSIYFEDLEEAILIVAVAHHKRRPGYWSRRLKP